MNADREPNRLPLRAGAMLLFAVAIVFIGLGWHSAATSGDDPEAALEAAQTASPTASAPATTSDAPSKTSKRVCVINAGTQNGLAGEVTDELKGKGFRMAAASNIEGGGFTENTILYDDDAGKALAQQVAEALGGSPSVEERPSSLTRCRGGIPVMIVTR